MKAHELKNLVGKKVKWRYSVNNARGSYLEATGTVTGTKGRNIEIDGEWMWAPDLNHLEECS